MNEPYTYTCCIYYYATNYIEQECAAVEGLPAMGPSLQLIKYQYRNNISIFAHHELISQKYKVTYGFVNNSM